MWSLAFLAASSVHGCGEASPACSNNVTTPIAVTVLEHGTGLDVCDAQVTASDGSSTYHAVEVTTTKASCSYTINPGTSGTFTITASAPMLSMMEKAPTVSLQYGECGYGGSTQLVTIVLSP